MATLKSKLALLRGLLSRDTAYTGPAWVSLDVTRRCNTVCLGCFYHCIQPRDPSPGDPEVKDLPFELAERLSKEWVQLHTPEVILLGEGEPLLHPRYLDVIGVFKKTGLRVQSFTNGTLLDQEMAERLVDSGLDVLNVTLWAVNEAEHAYWHPGESLSYLDRRRRGLERLASAKSRKNQSSPRVNIQLPLNRNNFTNLEERVDLVLASGCEEITLGFFRDWGGQFEDRCLLPEDGESMRAGLQSARTRFEAAGIGHNVDEYLARIRWAADAWRSVPCYAGWYQSYVKVDGTVLACGHCSLVMGNLHDHPFAEIWNGPAYKEFRRQSANPEGLLSLKDRCDCANCCLWSHNVRVHRAFRWFAPLMKSRKPSQIEQDCRAHGSHGPGPPSEIIQNK